MTNIVFDLTLDRDKQKFVSLVKYFIHLEEDDLKYFTVDMLVKYCEPKDRMIMRVFALEYLKPIDLLYCDACGIQK